MGAERGLIGYKGICTEKGIYVEADNAFVYVMERIQSDPILEEEYQKAVSEWFFSGDFVKVYEDEEETEEWRR